MSAGNHSDPVRPNDVLLNKERCGHIQSDGDVLGMGNGEGGGVEGNEDTSKKSGDSAIDDEVPMVCQPCVEEDAGESDLLEGVAPRIAMDPGTPTAKERREHALTHVPFRAWCRHCARARAKAWAQKSLHAPGQVVERDRLGFD